MAGRQANAASSATRPSHGLVSWTQALKKVELTDYFTRFTYKVCGHAACMRPAECSPWVHPLP